MQAYATTTRTRRNIDAMRDAGWRLLLTPDISDDWGMGYAIDNGAYGCFLRGAPFNADRFRRLLSAYGERADWCVVPDIVSAGNESLDFSLEWLPECLSVSRRVLLAVQDGMSAQDILPHVSDRVGIFVGGSTDWKLKTIPLWGGVAKSARCYLHVGRVNSQRRIRYCAGVGADSFDGTSVTRYSVELPKLDFTTRQGHLRW